MRSIFICVSLMIHFIASSLIGLAQQHPYLKEAKGSVRTIEKMSFDRVVKQGNNWIVKDTGVYEKDIVSYDKNGMLLGHAVSQINTIGQRDTTKIKVSYQYTDKSLSGITVTDGRGKQQNMPVKWKNDTCYYYEAFDAANGFTTTHTIVLGRDGYIKKWKVLRLNGDGDTLNDNHTKYQYNADRIVTGEKKYSYLEGKERRNTITILKKDDHNNPLMSVVESDVESDCPSARLIFTSYSYYK